MLKNQRAASHLDSILVVSATFPDPHKLSPGEEDDCAGLLGAWARSLSSTSSLISPLFSSPFLAERELSFGAKRDERARARATS